MKCVVMLTDYDIYMRIMHGITEIVSILERGPCTEFIENNFSNQRTKNNWIVVFGTERSNEHMAGVWDDIRVGNMWPPHTTHYVFK